MTRCSLLVTGNHLNAEFADRMLRNGIEVRHLPEPASPSVIAEQLAGVEAYILGGPEYLDSALLSQASELRFVAVMGVGTPSFIDVDAAKKFNITVCNTPAANTDSVAEFAVAMISAVSANVFSSTSGVQTGNIWRQTSRPALSDMHAGIVGLGNIGSSVARLLRRNSQMPIAYHSRRRKYNLEKEFDIHHLSLPELVRTADVLLLHLSYTHETHFLFNQKILGLMKPSAMLLNFSNPRIIDPTALKEKLTNSQIVCLMDGYYNEWSANKGVKYDPYGLLAFYPERFIALSHIAALTRPAIENCFEQAAEHVTRYFDSRYGRTES